MFTQETLSNYLHVNTNMSSLEKFDPTRAINCWMAKKKRRPKSHAKAHQQEWFNGVFDEAKEKKQFKPIIKF